MTLTALNEYVVASYYLEAPADKDPYEIAKRFAIGQTTGTWTDVPGLSAKARARFEGQVVNIVGVPALRRRL